MTFDSHLVARSPALRPSRMAWVLFVLLALGVFVADQASKWAAIATLTDAMDGLSEGAGSQAGFARFWGTLHPTRIDSVEVHPDWFHFRYVENPGAAWGFLSGSASAYRTPFFLAVSLGAMGFILQYFRRSHAEQRTLRVALGLVFGGALGNFVDRIRLGYVIDFIDWHLKDTFYWPTFNVADAAITVGVLLLVLTSVTERPLAPSSAKLTV